MFFINNIRFYRRFCIIYKNANPIDKTINDGDAASSKL